MRKERIDEIWSEFEQVQSAIEEWDKINEQEVQRIEFEETYFRATAEAEKFIIIKSKEALGTSVELSGNIGNTTQNISDLTINNLPVKLAALKVGDGGVRWLMGKDDEFSSSHN